MRFRPTRAHAIAVLLALDVGARTLAGASKALTLWQWVFLVVAVLVAGSTGLLNESVFKKSLRHHFWSNTGAVVGRRDHRVDLEVLSCGHAVEQAREWSSRCSARLCSRVTGFSAQSH
ncbi:hypothetical protein [Amycolatopsis anabasis]|uniref:hypothetical protein n=1 Tax=Amycolatopsis anabasis TaxID=1840409 RepID=UPI00131DE613|nr:hypothetical protein [Amycolatopsis anabasis]